MPSENLQHRRRAFSIINNSMIFLSTSCLDADECNASVPVCDVNAKCINTIGSFTCVCKTGFSGEGLKCSGNCESQLSFVFWLNCIHAYIWSVLFSRLTYLFYLFSIKKSLHLTSIQRLKATVPYPSLCFISNFKQDTLVVSILYCSERPCQTVFRL